MSQLSQSQELGSVLAQLGVDIPAPTFWQGITSAPIQTSTAPFAPGAVAASTEYALNDQPVGQRLANANETARWRGICTAVDIILTPDPTVATNVGDATLLLDNLELRVLGPGGELRIPLYSGLKIAPGIASSIAAPATTITGCPTGGNGTYKLPRAYWIDTETTRNLRATAAFGGVVGAFQSIKVVFHGVFAMNTKSRNDTYKSVPGVDPTGRDCRPNSEFIAEIAQILRRQGQPALLNALTNNQ